MKKIRKISIGSDYKNDAMHYSVGQEVYGGHNIVNIIEEEDKYSIYIEKNEEGKKFNSIESHFGTFRRSFTLPENINKDKIKANHTHGILIIEIPKDMKKMIKKSIAIS